MNVLLIEDDIQLNKAIRLFLELKNFKVTSSMDGEEALDIIDKKSFDIYIVDINLPHVGGLELTQYIRKKDVKAPILIITASAEIDNFLTAHENGCSEYIKKPFHLKELEVRMDKLLEMSCSQYEELSENVKFDNQFKELWINDEKVILRKKEQRLLSVLIENINHTVYIDTITDYVWENEIKESYPLRQLVNELRKKLQIYSDLIQTDTGVGYSIYKNKTL